jgi:hypothetical protein
MTLTDAADEAPLSTPINLRFMGVDKGESLKINSKGHKGINKSNLFIKGSKFLKNFFLNKKQLSNKKISPYCFSTYNAIKPSHKKVIDSRFLEWFIGFSEGDGCFCKKDAYLIFVINQADLLWSVKSCENNFRIWKCKYFYTGWACLCATSYFKSRKYLTFNCNV